MPSPARRPVPAPSAASVPPPHDIEAEPGLVSAVLYRPGAWDRLSGILSPENFYDPACAAIWRAYQDLSREGIPFEKASIRARLVDTGDWAHHFNLPGQDVLSDLMQRGHVIERSEIPAARRIVSYHRLRKLIDKCHEIGARGYFERENIDSFISSSIDDLSELVRDSIAGGEEVTPIESIKAVMATLSTAAREAKEAGGIVRPYVGLRELDRKLGGFRPAKTYVIAARPGVGKSALVMQAARNLASTSLKKRAVAVFNLEMSAEELTLRNLCSMAEVDAKKMIDGEDSYADWERLTGAATDYQHYPLFIVDKTFYIEPLVSQAKEMAARIKRESKGAVELGMVVVDYLQLLMSRTSRTNETAEAVISKCSRILKLLSKDLDVPVIALSQLKRPDSKSVKQRPSLSDLRGSGSIEQDADVVIFITREEVELRDKTPLDKRGLAELDIAKHRGGPTGSCFVKFIDRYTVFKDWTGPMPFEERAE